MNSKNVLAKMTLYMGVLLLCACQPPPLPVSQYEALTQSPLDEPVFDNAAIQHGQYRLEPQRRHSVTARVLSIRDYRGEPQGDLMFVDFALGWGDMATDEMLDEIKITQRNRWYYWRTKTRNIPKKKISSQSSNYHIIADSDEVKKRLLDIEKDDVVVMHGHLVDMRGAANLDTSTSRYDTGGGACEILLVKSVFRYSVP